MTSDSTRPPGGIAACPDEETLAALALGELEPPARASIGDHVIGCPKCAADFRLLRELHREAAGSRPRFWRSRWTWLAAGLAAAVAGIVLAPRLVRDGAERTRGPAASVHPADGAVLSAPPETLAWSAVAGVQGYRVKLFGADGTPVWASGTLGEATARLPPEVRAGMGGSRSWYWTVESLGPVRQRRMGPYWFHLRGP